MRHNLGGDDASITVDIIGARGYFPVVTLDGVSYKETESGWEKMVINAHTGSVAHDSGRSAFDSAQKHLDTLIAKRK